MKRIFLALMLSSISFFALAQEAEDRHQEDSITSIVEKIVDRKFKSRITVDFCTSLNGNFTDNGFDGTSFKLNRLRLELRGRISDQFSYRVRQSFNKSFTKNSLDNVPSSLEYANLQWHPNSNFKLTIGKQFLAIGGYEALANSMYVREFSEFNDCMSFYRLGVNADFKFASDQTFSLQFVNNRNGKDSDLYAYGLPEGLESSKFPFLASVCWNGYFADKALNFIYAASAGPVAKGKNIYYLSCGNIYEKGPVLAYLDVMYSREEVDNQQRVTSLQGGAGSYVTAQNVDYLSFIAKFDYRFHPKWNAYVKGAYETAGVYQANGPFQKGTYMTSWNAQASIEWHPFTSDKGLKVFAHYVYKGHQLADNALTINGVKPSMQRISLGLIYVIRVL